MANNPSAHRSTKSMRTRMKAAFFPRAIFCPPDLAAFGRVCREGRFDCFLFTPQAEYSSTAAKATKNETRKTKQRFTVSAGLPRNRSAPGPDAIHVTAARKPALREKSFSARRHRVCCAKRDTANPFSGHRPGDRAGLGTVRGGGIAVRCGCMEHRRRAAAKLRHRHHADRKS